jgi:AraC-like DNA-binding protein
MTKRLRLSESELARIVDRIGNSIPTIIKEVALQRARPLTESTQIPASAAVAASAPPEPDILSESEGDMDQRLVTGDPLARAAF